MNREELFLEYLSTCMKNLQICGQGNPNADILIIGQEQASDVDLSKQDMYGEHLRSLVRNYDLCLRKELRCCPRDKKDPHNGKKIADTWLNYQKLINLIYPQNQAFLDIVDFEKHAFTTELGSKARKNSLKDNQTAKEIADRLVVLERSEFIQSFPIVILACSNYIENNKNVREIDRTFHVEFCKEYGDKKNRNRFWTHTDKCNPERLVIHTRQFSNGISNKMIECMAEVIKSHIENQLKKQIM